eukprot:9562986-Karenia_brevis.AAC.1
MMVEILEARASTNTANHETQDILSDCESDDECLIVSSSSDAGVGQTCITIDSSDDESLADGVVGPPCCRHRPEAGCDEFAEPSYEYDRPLFRAQSFECGRGSPHAPV